MSFLNLNLANNLPIYEIKLVFGTIIVVKTRGTVFRFNPNDGLQ